MLTALKKEGKYPRIILSQRGLGCSHYRLHGIDGLRPKRSTYIAQFKLQVLPHKDREQLSSRHVAAVYDIRNPNQVVVWRRKLDEGGVEALGSRNQERPNMKL